MFAVINSNTSSIAKEFVGQTFEVKELTPMQTIMKINGKESILSHRDVLIIDIENEMHDAYGQWQAVKDNEIFLKGKKDLISRVQAKYYNLKAYCLANRINIDVEINETDSINSK